MIWLLLVLLLPLALLLLRPVWYQAETNPHSEENLRLYRERTEELKHADLEDDERQTMQLELDREFLANAATDDASGAASGNSWALIGIMLLICAVGSFSLYRLWGADNELRATALLDKGSQVQLTARERSELLDRMAVAAADHQGGTEWDFLNARLLNANGRYEEAASAFAAILEELPAEAEADRAATLALLAESRFFAADQQADEQTYQLMRQALELNPDSRQSLGLAGIMAFELGKYQEAIDHWHALWSLVAGGPEAQVLAQGIRRAADQLQNQGQEVDVSWLDRGRLQLVVDISPEARAALTSDTTVFVLARAVQGPPAPLAVQRLTVAELPARIVLDDSMAMIAGRNISSVEQVTLVARASVSGQPMPQSGDWQVVQEAVDTADSGPYELVIDQAVE